MIHRPGEVRGFALGDQATVYDLRMIAGSLPEAHNLKMKYNTASAVMFLVVNSAFAACPPGQIPGHDTHGNRACISTTTQQVVALEAIQDAHCSPGYERKLDPHGQYYCLDQKSGVNANPRKANCPPGTWLKSDPYGFERCFPVP